MAEQVPLDRDLRDLSVVERLAHQAQHLHGSFRERHLGLELVGSDEGPGGSCRLRASGLGVDEATTLAPTCKPGSPVVEPVLLF